MPPLFVLFIAVNSSGRTNEPHRPPYPDYLNIVTLSCTVFVLFVAFALKILTAQRNAFRQYSLRECSMVDARKQQLTLRCKEIAAI